MSERTARCRGECRPPRSAVRQTPSFPTNDRSEKAIPPPKSLPPPGPRTHIFAKCWTIRCLRKIPKPTAIPRISANSALESRELRGRDHFSYLRLREKSIRTLTIAIHALHHGDLPDGVGPRPRLSRSTARRWESQPASRPALFSCTPRAADGKTLNSVPADRRAGQDGGTTPRPPCSPTPAR